MSFNNGDKLFDINIRQIPHNYIPDQPDGANEWNIGNGEHLIGKTLG